MIKSRDPCVSSLFKWASRKHSRNTETITPELIVSLDCVPVNDCLITTVWKQHQPRMFNIKSMSILYFSVILLSWHLINCSLLSHGFNLITINELPHWSVTKPKFSHKFFTIILFALLFLLHANKLTWIY